MVAAGEVKTTATSSLLSVSAPGAVAGRRVTGGKRFSNASAASFRSPISTARLNIRKNSSNEASKIHEDFMKGQGPALFPAAAGVNQA